MDQGGRTELHNVIIDGLDEDARNLILSGNCDLNEQDEQGYTPLHAAAKCGRVEIARLLISSGADLTLLDSWGNTILMRALGPSEQSKELIKLFLAHGVDPHKKNLNGISVLDHVGKLKMHPNRELFQDFLSDS